MKKTRMLCLCLCCLLLLLHLAACNHTESPTDDNQTTIDTEKNPSEEQEPSSGSPITPDPSPDEPTPAKHEHSFAMGKCEGCDIIPMKQWDISKAGDESLIAYLFDTSDNSAEGTFYTLEIAGIGEMYEPGFNELMPWADPYREKITNIVFNGSLTHISKTAFSNCSIKSIDLPESLIYIGESAFSGCDIISINIPAAVTTIGDYAFFSCNNLTDVNIPLGLQTIGKYAFQSCRSLKTVTFGKTATSDATTLSIKEGAFSYCNNLTNMALPSHVTQIGFDAFSYCSESLFSVENGIKYFGNWLIKAELPNIRDVVFKDGIVGIADEAFQNCDNLTELEIPNSVLHVGEYVFSGCDGLLSIILPNTVTTVSAGLFNNCSSLTNVVLPKYATEIGNHAFTNCDSLKAIIIPVEITHLKASAFYSCDSLEQIVFNTQSVTNIDQYCFYECNALKYVFFSGLQEHWDNIIVEQGNTPFKNCILVFNNRGHIHTIEHVEGNAPTCHNIGYTDSAYCTECNAVVIAREEIPTEQCDYDEHGICLSCGEPR